MTFLSLLRAFLGAFTPSANKYLLSTLYWKVTPRQRRAAGEAGRGAEDSEKAAVLQALGTGEKEEERG